MLRKYEEPELLIMSMQEDVVTASSGSDPFDDGYTDFGDGN